MVVLTPMATSVFNRQLSNCGSNEITNTLVIYLTAFIAERTASCQIDK